ncbi:MAG: hypothetical protein PUD45_02355 [Lactobacillus sp.]|nr:hypothetical protein [Lactobacillus sp.]
MMKQSKHWLTGLLMTAMVLSLTGCASLSAPTSTQESTSHSVAVSSKTKVAKKHSTSVKDQSTSASSEAAQSSSMTAESASADQSTGALASSAQAAGAQSTAASETTSSPASNKASAATSSTVNDQVVDGLNQAANLQPENGDQYMTSQTSDGNWQVDIRTSSGEGQDPNVSHLKGIYKYNPTTGQYQQMDPMTGEFN